MTHSDLTELQIEISELEKENQDLKDRIQELEINFAYVEQQLQKSDDTQTAKCGTGSITTNDSVIH